MSPSCLSRPKTHAVRHSCSRQFHWQKTTPKLAGHGHSLEGPQHELPIPTKKLPFQGRSGLDSSRHLPSTFYDQILCSVLTHTSQLSQQIIFLRCMKVKEASYLKRTKCTLWIKKGTFRIFCVSPILGNRCDYCLKSKLFWIPKYRFIDIYFVLPFN